MDEPVQLSVPLAVAQLAVVTSGLERNDAPFFLMNMLDC